MTTSLPIKKLYLDTRYRTTDSVSTSNFKIELPMTLYMPNNCVFYITDVCIEHSWYTVETGINDKLYTQVGSTAYTPILTLTAKNYTGDTLATEIQTKLTALAIAGVSWTIAYISTTNAIKFSITGSSTFRVLTDLDILTNGQAVGDPQSCNDIFRNVEGTSAVYSNLSPYTSGSLDLQPVRNVYMSSPNMGTFTTLGSRGESNIIHKVPVNADYGYMVIDNVSDPHDYLECSKQTLRTLEFHLRDVKGNYIPMHGGHCSFSIIFSSFKEDI